MKIKIVRQHEDDVQVWEFYQKLLATEMTCDRLRKQPTEKNVAAWYCSSHFEKNDSLAAMKVASELNSRFDEIVVLPYRDQFSEKDLFVVFGKKRDEAWADVFSIKQREMSFNLTEELK